MSNRCFYCESEIEADQTHTVLFNILEREREEKLCDQCYYDWLEGIKE